MLRTGIWALDALLGSSGARGNIVGGISRGTGSRIVTPATRSNNNNTTNRVWARTIYTPTKAPTTNPARFWAVRFPSSGSSSRMVLRGSRTRAPLRTTAPRRPFQTSRARRQEGPSPKSKSHGNNEGSLSLSDRLKKLSREYGWTAVGVYLALSVLDFPFCFLLVRVVGTEKIAAIEEIVVSYAQRIIPENVKEFWHNYRKTLKENAVKQQGATAAGGEGEAVLAEDVEAETAGWGVKEAEERREKEGASLATQLALAYAIHKSFIFVRVPLTAAILPKVVKVLRSWGWNIGRKAGKAKSVK